MVVPAGLTASIYAQRSLLDAVTLEQEAFGGQTILTSEIDNYPGLPHTDGYTLSEAMRSQATDLGAEVRMEQVTGISRDDKSGLFTLVTPDGDLVAKSVILAGGATPRHAGFQGEEKLPLMEFRTALPAMACFTEESASTLWAVETLRPRRPCSSRALQTRSS